MTSKCTTGCPMAHPFAMTARRRWTATPCRDRDRAPEAAGRAGDGISAGGKYDQPWPPAPPQLMNRVQMQAAGQPAAAGPAGRQDHLVVVVSPGLGTDGLDQLQVADDAT